MRLKTIWVIWIQRKVSTAVVESEATALRHNTGSESHVIGVDEAASISLPVNHAEVNCAWAVFRIAVILK